MSEEESMFGCLDAVAEEARLILHAIEANQIGSASALASRLRDALGSLDALDSPATWLDEMRANQYVVETQRFGKRRWAWGVCEPTDYPPATYTTHDHPFARDHGVQFIGPQWYRRIKWGWARSEERARAKAERCIRSIQAREGSDAASKSTRHAYVIYGEDGGLQEIPCHQPEDCP